MMLFGHQYGILLSVAKNGRKRGGENLRLSPDLYIPPYGGRKRGKMELLKERIRRDGKVRAGGVLKVDAFLNHQMDVELFAEIGEEFRRRFAEDEVTKILTIEAS